MYASVDEFFYESVGGLSVAADAIGADHLIFAPQFSTASSASVSYESIRGTASISWNLESQQKGVANVNITVPVNTRADLLIPSGYSMVKSDMEEDGLFLSACDQNACRFGSGVFSFEFRYLH